MSRLSEFFHKSLDFLFYSLFFLTPLVLWPRTSEIFEFNKMLLVYALTGMIVAAWIGKSVADRKFQVRRTPLDIPLFLFFLSQIASTIFSIDPHTSIWGYYSRFHGGLASTVCYILLYYAFVSNVTQTRSRFYLLFSLLISTALISTYAILEHFGIDKDIWVQDVQSRVFSTLGQPNWLSAYLLAILPLPILLSLQADSKHKRLYWLLAGALFLSILYTKSQSGVATTFLTLSGLALFLIIFSRSTKTKTKPVFLLLIGFIVLALTIGTPWTPSPDQISTALKRGGPIWPQMESRLNQYGLSTVIKEIDPSTYTPQEKEHIAAIKEGRQYGGSSSMEIRRNVWQGAIELGKRYPILGTGLETFGYTYYWVRPASHNLLSEWDFLYNKAHNEYLNFLSNSGLTGLLTYLLVIFSTIYIFIKQFRSAKETDNKLLIAGLCFGYLSILFTNFFGFSVVAVALLFFLYPAISLVNSEKEARYLTLPIQINNKIAIAVISLLLIYWLNWVRVFFVSDIKYNTARSYLNSGLVGQALPLLSQAHQMYPQEPNFTAALAEANAQAAIAVHQQLESLPSSASATIKEQGLSMRQGFIDEAIEKSNLSIKQNKYQTNFYKSKAKVEIYLALIDPKYQNDALHTLLELTTYTPTDAKNFYNIGLIHQNLNNLEAAKLSFDRALELKPDYTSAREALTSIASTSAQEKP